MQPAQTYRKVCPRPRQAGKPFRNQERQTPKRTPQPAGHGFLKKTFAPVTGQRLAALGKPAALERELFNSLSHLTALYQLPVPALDGSPYPLNVARVLEQAKQSLQQKSPELELAVLRDKEKKIRLVTIKTYNTGGWLYYIPVKPLWEMHRNRRRKKQCFELLLSTCSYLFRIAGIPYYTDGSYLESTYDMLETWYQEIIEAGEGTDLTDESHALLEECRYMRHAGKKLLNSIRHPYQLEQWASRLQAFRPADEQQQELLKACQPLYNLWQQYGDRDILAATSTGIFYPEEEERIYPDYYISFFWDGEGLVYEQLIEAVNASFESASIVDEPISIQYFDTPQETETHDLRFEEGFFEAIHQLCAVLNNYSWKI